MLVILGSVNATDEPAAGHILYHYGVPLLLSSRTSIHFNPSQLYGTNVRSVESGEY
jgi:hypothetical protein